MADYICTYRTNYFRVTDEEKYQKLINKLAGEDLEIFDDENSNGMHGFGGTGSMSYCSAQTVAEWMNEPTHDRPVVRDRRRKSRGQPTAGRTLLVMPGTGD